MTTSNVFEYHRPTTRGELRDKLLQGVECEVVADNVGVTASLLEVLGLRKLYDFSIRASENKGWTVFYPRTKDET